MTIHELYGLIVEHCIQNQIVSPNTTVTIYDDASKKEFSLNSVEVVVTTNSEESVILHCSEKRITD